MVGIMASSPLLQLLVLVSATSAASGGATLTGPPSSKPALSSASLQTPGRKLGGIDAGGAHADPLAAAPHILAMEAPSLPPVAAQREETRLPAVALLRHRSRASQPQATLHPDPPALHVDAAAMSAKAAIAAAAATKGLAQAAAAANATRLLTVAETVAKAAGSVKSGEAAEAAPAAQRAVPVTPKPPAAAPVQAKAATVAPPAKAATAPPRPVQPAAKQPQQAAAKPKAPQAPTSNVLPFHPPPFFLGLPKIFWALVADALAMLAFVACIPFILTIAKRRRPPAPANN